MFCTIFYYTCRVFWASNFYLYILEIVGACMSNVKLMDTDITIFVQYAMTYCVYVKICSKQRCMRLLAKRA